VSFEQLLHKSGLKTAKNTSSVAWDNINFRGTCTFEAHEELPKMEELMLPMEGYQPAQQNNNPLQTNNAELFRVLCDIWMGYP